MRRKITTKQFENMITECVGQVLAESQQPQNKRIRMNEAQMQRYVQNIINEELENEGFMDYLKGGGKQMAQSIGSGLSNVGNSIATGAKKMANGAIDTAKGAYGKAKQFAQDVNQAGNNASFVADTQKLAQQVQQVYQKYGNNLTNGYKMCLQNAYTALNKLVQSCQNGEMNA